MSKAPFLILVITFLLFGFFALFYVDAPHDGIVFKAAVDLTEGRMVFRDSYTQYGALFTVIQALGLDIFGKHILVPRLVTLLFYSATGVALWFIYRRFLPTVWNAGAIMLWWALAPVYTWFFHSWSSVPAAFFQTISILLFLWFTEKPQGRYMFLVGLTSMLSFWCRQPVGIVHTIGIVFIWGILWKANIYPKKIFVDGSLSLVAGIVIGLAPVVVWLIVAHALTDWWLQSILMQLPFAQETRGTAPLQIIKSLMITRFWKSFPLYSIWLAIPLTTLMIATQNIGKLVFNSSSKKLRAIQYSILGVLGVCSWNQYYPVTEPLHFFWACTPMIGLFVVGIYEVRQRLSKKYKIVVFVLFFGGIFLYLLWSIRAGFIRIASATAVVRNPAIISGIFMKKEHQLFYENVNSTLLAFFLLYPEKTYINDSNIAFYPLFYPSRFVPIRGLYVSASIISRVYPTLDQERREYVAKTRPLVFTRATTLYPDYCDMNVISTDEPPIKLLIPREIGRELQYRWTTINPTLRPFQCN